MKAGVLAVCMLLCISGAVQADVPACNQQGHDRWEWKNRPTPLAGYTPIPKRIGTWLTWAVPAPASGAREANESLDPREDAVYVITGYVRRLKQDTSDCDLHLEMTGTRSSNKRMIAEVPRSQLVVQNRLWNGLTLTAQQTDFAPADAPLITVVGYGFIDYSHYSKKNPRKGHQHGSAAVQTLWELHPVFDGWVGR